MCVKRALQKLAFNFQVLIHSLIIDNVFRFTRARLMSDLLILIFGYLKTSYSYTLTDTFVMCSYLFSPATQIRWLLFVAFQMCVANREAAECPLVKKPCINYTTATLNLHFSAVINISVNTSPNG